MAGGENTNRENRQTLKMETERGSIYEGVSSVLHINLEVVVAVVSAGFRRKAINLDPGKLLYITTTIKAE